MKTTEDFIKSAKKIHQNKFDYSLVEYKGAKIPIKIKCLNSHIFEQKPNDHLNGFGCKICRGWGVLKNDNNEFINRAKIIHGAKYNYSKSFYSEHDTPLIIICPIHGEFKQTPKGHLIDKSGCPKCSHIVGGDKRRWSLGTFIQKAKQIHGLKYDYSLVKYKSAIIKVEIICLKHGNFKICPKDHINLKQGCPICSESKGEREIREHFRNINLEFKQQHKFKECINPKTNKQLPFDFYLPQHNLCVEFHGEQHYHKVPFFNKRNGGLKSLKERDEIKKTFCILNNINYLEISYKDFKNIKQILNNNVTRDNTKQY